MRSPLGVAFPQTLSVYYPDAQASGEKIILPATKQIN
jgi:hypothetical protein